MVPWFNKNRHITVKDFIERIASWVEAGFVSSDVWQDLKRVVSSHTLTPYIHTVSDVKKREQVSDDCKLSQVIY